MRFAVFNKVVREDFFEKVRFKKGFKGVQDSQTEIWGKNILDRGNSRTEQSEICLESLRNSREVGEAGPE